VAILPALKGRTMKAVTGPIQVRKATNCTGPDEGFTEQDFEIEACDVGRDKEHYLGHRHRTYRFIQSDIGRRIRTTQQGNWYYCWSFTNTV
jgi:hypothetical protein